MASQAIYYSFTAQLIALHLTPSSRRIQGMAKRIPEHPFVAEVRAKLEHCRGNWPEVVEKSGVSHSWISQFVRRIITNPTIQNLQQINRACDEIMQGPVTVRGR